ncbi:MAG: hypothetical protein WDW38_008133 [Sanguina aurantia]
MAPTQCILPLCQRGQLPDTLKEVARSRMRQQKPLFHCTVPTPQALKDREEAVRNGKLTTIIFIRDTNSKGQEVSGYIDFGHRLKTENMEPYFDRRKKLMPRATDLSFYNWETQMSTSNPTPNFQVIADNEAGLLFKNKRDRKVINVDPRVKPGDNSTRTEQNTSEYVQVVIYDHVTRRRS